MIMLMKLTSRTRIIHLMSGVDFPKDETFYRNGGTMPKKKDSIQEHSPPLF